MIYIHIFAYLIVKFATFLNPKLPYEKCSDSIQVGFGLLIIWFIAIVMNPIATILIPNIWEYNSENKIFSVRGITTLTLFLVEFLYFEINDRWKVVLEKVDNMESNKRKKLCWHVIYFLGFAVVISIYLNLTVFPISK